MFYCEENCYVKYMIISMTTVIILRFKRLSYTNWGVRNNFPSNLNVVCLCYAKKIHQWDKGLYLSDGYCVRECRGNRKSVHYCILVREFCFWRNSPQWARASLFTRFLDHTQRRTTVGTTPLDEWSARRRDLYPTAHTTLTTETHPCRRWDSNPQSQQASGRRPTPLDRAVTGFGLIWYWFKVI